MGDELVYEKSYPNRFKGKAEPDSTFDVIFFENNEFQYFMVRTDGLGEFDVILPIYDNLYDWGCTPERIDCLPPKANYGNYPNFRNQTNLVSINLKGLTYNSKWDITTLSMFYGCTSLPFIDVSPLGSRFGNDSREMFKGCFKLGRIEFSPLSKSFNMENMFYGCFSLKELDLKNLVQEYTDTEWVFYHCQNLRKIKMQKFYLNALPIEKQNGVDEARECFYNCRSLEEIEAEPGAMAVSANFGDCPLNHDSALIVIQSLINGTGSQVIFSKRTYSTLTQDEIALATSRGRTIIEWYN